MKYLVLSIFGLLFLGCSSSLTASYKKLSQPEKRWVKWHVFKAKKAYKISKEAEKTKDSIAKTNQIGTDNNGGGLDAFKHAYWMARLTQDIGKNAATRLGILHEKGNYKTFENRQMEDGQLPDQPSTTMDLHNNAVGVNIGKTNKGASKATLIKIILDSLKQQKLKVLLKDDNGNFLDCDKNVIPLDSLKHRWNTKKCVVSSGY